MVVMEDVTEEERSAELYVSVHGGLDHTMVTAMGGWVNNLGLFPKKQIGGWDVCVWLT